MSAEKPGRRESAIATKATVHKAPVVELGMPGIAFKSAQAQGAYPNETNAAAAQRIAVGEEFVILLEGEYPVAVADLPRGARAGDPLYITIADNALADAAEALTAGLVEAAYAKFGRIVSIDTDLGFAQVNLNLRDTF